MVLKGCTACYDLFVEFPGPSEDGIDAVAEAYQSVGMRAVIAPMLADLTFYQAIPGLSDALPPALQASVGGMRMPPWEETVATMRRILSSWRFDRDWLLPAVAPTIPLHCQDSFLVACRDLAREFGLGMHSHVAESKVQAVSGQTRYGRSLVAHLDALGLISDRFTAAHGIWLDADDMARLGGHGASVAHNPASNMRLGNGVADVRAMLASGINVGLGTDAATCGDNLNMYGSMHFAAGSSHARSPDPADWITAEQVWAAATTGSARALGFAHVGRIAPGYAADLVFLDLDSPTLIPLNAPVNQLVFGEDGTSVREVMIGGRFVVRDGRLLTVDLPALAARAEALRIRMLERNAERRSAFECVVPLLYDFCPSLTRTKWPFSRYCGC